MLNKIKNARLKKYLIFCLAVYLDRVPNGEKFGSVCHERFIPETIMRGCGILWDIGLACCHSVEMCTTYLWAILYGPPYALKRKYQKNINR